MSADKLPVIAFMNQKGGVGKTTEASIFAQYLALIEGKKIGVGDTDLQCNISDELVGMDPMPQAIGGQLPPLHPDYDPNSNTEERSSLADCFYGKCFLPYESWINEKSTTSGGYIDVFCGHPQKLEDINTAFARDDDLLDTKVHQRLREVLHDDEFKEYYDAIILDTGPSRSPIFRAALRAATHIVIPFTPEEKDIQGINAMLQIIRQENYSRSNDIGQLKLIGLSPNKVRHTNLHEKNLALFLEDHEEITFPKESWLSLLTAFPERDTKDSKPKSVFDLPETNKAKQQAIAFGRYIYSKIFGEPKDV